MLTLILFVVVCEPWTDLGDVVGKVVMG